MLTRKQYELLLFIDRRLKDSGVSPSFDEMKDALSLKSKSGIHRLITALEERGFIRRLPHRARALEVIKLPDHATRPQAQQLGANVVEGPGWVARSGGRQLTPATAGAEIVELPLAGRIAAGLPIEAIEQEAERVSVPASMLRGSGEHFALEVRGESMIEAGILDGDLAIISAQAATESGDIVVAVIAENEEATLKRLRKRGATIALEAANPAFQTKIYKPNQVDIRGRLVGVIRHY